MGFYQDHCVYLPAMAGWFLFSALLSSYNKVVFGNGHGMMKFPCPLLLTSIHFFVQWIFSWLVTRDRACGGREALGGDRVEQMGWKEYLAIALPCGLVTSGDVGLSNLSLVTLSITFYTMVKASTPIWVLIWAYLFGIEKITSMLLLVVGIIALGEFLTVFGEVDFHWRGFLLCLGASILSGARWTLVQLKIQSMDPPLKTTLATMRLLSPSMFVSMLTLSIVVERPWISMREYGQHHDLQSTMALGVVGAVFAIAMILCEFYLIMHASAIILMIGGVVKEMITIIVGVSFFGDPLNRINITGCFIVFCGVVLYKVSYHIEKKAKRDEVLKGSDHGRSVEYRMVDEQHELDLNGELPHLEKDKLRALSPKKDTEFFEDDDELATRRLSNGQHSNGTSGVEIVSMVRSDSATKHEII